MNTKKRLLIALPLFWLTSTYSKLPQPTEPSVTQDGNDNEEDFYAHVQQLQKSRSANRTHVAPQHHTTKRTKPAATPTSSSIVSEPTQEQAQKTLEEAGDTYNTYRETLPRDEAPTTKPEVVNNSAQQRQREQLREQLIEMRLQHLSAAQEDLAQAQKREDSEKAKRLLEVIGAASLSGLAWLVSDRNPLVEYASCGLAVIALLDASRRTYFTIPRVTNQKQTYQEEVNSIETNLQELQSAQAK